MHAVFLAGRGSTSTALISNRVTRRQAGRNCLSPFEDRTSPDGCTTPQRSALLAHVYLFSSRYEKTESKG
jgi:hypothetical protein